MPRGSRVRWSCPGRGRHGCESSNCGPDRAGRHLRGRRSPRSRTPRRTPSHRATSGAMMAVESTAHQVDPHGHTALCRRSIDRLETRTTSVPCCPWVTGGSPVRIASRTPAISLPKRFGHVDPRDADVACPCPPLEVSHALEVPKSEARHACIHDPELLVHRNVVVDRHLPVPDHRHQPGLPWVDPADVEVGADSALELEAGEAHVVDIADEPETPGGHPTGRASSKYIMMDTSCGAKFQRALQSFRMRPRLRRCSTGTGQSPSSPSWIQGPGAPDRRRVEKRVTDHHDQSGISTGVTIRSAPERYQPGASRP